MKKYIWALSLSLLFVTCQVTFAMTPAVKKGAMVTKTPMDEGKMAVKSKQPTPRSDGEEQAPTVDEPKPEIDPVKEFLGSEIIEILSNPASVQTFVVGPELAESTVPEKNRLGGFPILKEGPKLTPEQIKPFQTLVLDKGSYFFERDKRCLFRPDTGLYFVKGEKDVEMLISFSCAKWLFFYDGNEKMEDFDPAYKPLKKLRDSWFPAPPAN
jgi:hypothetical protein